MLGAPKLECHIEPNASHVGVPTSSSHHVRWKNRREENLRGTGTSTHCEVVGMRVLLLVQWLAMASPSTAPVHDVARGESLWSIAAAHHCTVAELRKANPKLVEPLRAGARLELPARARVPAPAPAKKTTPAKAVKKIELAEPAPARTHRVVAGDTLGAIARRHEVTIAELQRRNALRGTTIVVGQVLVLGDAVEPTPAPAEAKELPAPPTARFDLPPPPRADSGGSAGGGRKPSPAPALVGAVQLPRDRAYYLRHPKRAYGLPHVVESTRAAVMAVKEKHPRVHRLAIGDLSAQSGGRLSGHKSHRTGRDVDIGLYFRRSPSSYPQKFVGAKSAPVDLAATWALIEAFYEQSQRAGGPVQIFLDFEVQGEIHDWARKHGVSRRVLREVFQYPHGRYARRGLVRHEPAHDDHLHVRFGCPKGTRCP
jgi:LysM repeat protein